LQTFRESFFLQLAATVALLGVLVGADYVIYGANAARSHQTVISEFQRIRPLSSAVIQYRTDNYRPPWRNHQGTFGAYYSAADADSVIRQHYDKELRSQGWRLVADEPVKSWGKASGEQLFYCKQSLYAGLYFRGAEFERQKPSTSEYEFVVAWGSRPNELKGKCD